jgi:acyl-coenzyme A thioesterase PaaI-like protein
MPTLQLPHTRGCLVCGKQNPAGLHLSLHIIPESGRVTCDFTPRVEHIGFEGVIHGGLLATVVDEAMVWAATWRGRRFCLCAELTVRYRKPVDVGKPLKVEADVEFSRPRLIQTAAKIFDESGNLVTTASGKYVPLSPDEHRTVLTTFVQDPETAAAALELAKEVW